METVSLSAVPVILGRDYGVSSPTRNRSQGSITLPSVVVCTEPDKEVHLMGRPHLGPTTRLGSVPTEVYAALTAAAAQHGYRETTAYVSDILSLHVGRPDKLRGPLSQEVLPLTG